MQYIYNTLIMYIQIYVYVLNMLCMILGTRATCIFIYVHIYMHVCVAYCHTAELLPVVHPIAILAMLQLG